MDTLDPAALAIAQSYDAVPYDSHPFPQTHPARSAALASLFGLNPPDVATARVLELGCASGGNLIPLAASFPQASFVGVDLSENQIAAGRARIAQVGLKNITLRHQSIMDISPGLGTFDYIICHGVYSWVPHPVREAILRVLGQNLTDKGVAYLSYNVHPGWRLRGVLRDAMLFHVDGETRPVQRTSKARTFLNQLAEITDAGTPYGQMLRQEAKGLAACEDYYVLHEYLEHTNDPCYVADLIGKANNAGLAYLTEANVTVTIAETFGPEKGRLLRELSGNGLARMEQYIDFLTGRTFRQSLLVHTSQESAIQRTLGAACLDGLNLQAKVTLTNTGSDSFMLADPAGRTLTTASPFVADCLVRLGAQFPRSVTPETLADSGNPSAPASAADLANLRDALFKMTLIGMVELTSVAISPELAVSPYPLALALARADARSGRPSTTNARHETVPLNVVQRAILPLLDGTHDFDALAQHLCDQSADHHITFEQAGSPITNADDVAQAAREHLSAALAALATAALLISAERQPSSAGR